MRIFVLCALLALAPPSPAAAPGAAMPHFALPRADGSVVDSATLAGRVVLVDFWASWCAPCRQSFPFLGELQRRHRERGLVVVAINVDEERSDAERFLAEVPAGFEVVYDPAGITPRGFAVKGMPSSYLVDRGGRVALVQRGFRAAYKAELERAVERLLAADPAP